jgi:HK97 family phage portal protein
MKIFTAIKRFLTDSSGKRSGDEAKASRVSPILVTRSGGSGAIWPERNYDNFAKESYLKNIVAFRAIDEIARSVASVPWRQYGRLDDGGRELVVDDFSEKILKRPNPNEGWSFMMLKAVAYLVMSGNSFLEKITPETGANKDSIKELYAHRPDRFKIVANQATGQISKYVYRNLGREVEWDVDVLTGKSDILHIKSFHPLSDWWGAAATESAAREIDTSNSATEWNKSILDNEGRPGMVFTLIGAAGEEYLDQLEEYLRESHSGASNAGKNLILSGESGTKAEPYGWSPKDLDFNEGDLRLSRKIAMGYGVPPMLLGIPGEATFANYKEARLAFWESTVFFYLNYFKDELNNWIYGDSDDRLFLDYDLDNVPALAVKRDMLWERAEKSNFLTINQKLELVGYESIGEKGDVILVPSNTTTLETVVSGSEEGEEGESKHYDKEVMSAIDELKAIGYDPDEIANILRL